MVLNVLIFAKHLMHVCFCKTKHWITKVGGQWSICHWPSTHTIFNTFNPHWKTTSSHCANKLMVMDIKILYNVGLWKRNGHSRMKKINTIWFTRVTFCHKRRISGLFCRTKNLFTLEVLNPCCEQKPQSIIRDGYCKSCRIAWPLGPS
jgi:hypothetical protein